MRGPALGVPGLAIVEAAEERHEGPDDKALP